MRQPYAMRTLISQVSARVEDATVEAGDPDGFGVYRSVTFGGVTEWLNEHHIENIAADPRISAAEVDGDVTIRFVVDSRADSAAPFYLRREPRIPQPVVEEADPDYEDAVAEVEAEDEVAARRKELTDTPVAELREIYGYGTDTKKPAIIDAILGDEFPDWE